MTQRTRPSLALGVAAPAIAMAILASAAPLHAAPDAAADSTSGTGPLTIEQCVSLALERAPDVRASTQDLTAAQLDSSAARLNRRPAFALFGGATVAPSGFYDPAITNLGEYGLKVGVTAPLLDAGARRRERAQAELGAASAAANRDLASRDAGIQAAGSSLGILRQQELESADRDALDWLDQLGALIQSGVRAGVHGRSDAVRVQLARDAVVADLLSVRLASEALARQLAQLLAFDPPRTVSIVEPDATAEAAPADEDSVRLLSAVDRAPEVRVARAAALSSRLALDQVRRRNGLLVDLSADAGLWGSDLTRTVPENLSSVDPQATFGDRLRRDLGASVSLTFRRPLLDPSVGKAVGAQEARLRAGEGRLAAGSAKRRREILDLLGRWRTASERAALARTSLIRAEENLLRLRSLYAGGGSSLLDLLDGRQQVDDARIRLADARLEARLARWEGALQR